MQQSRAFRNVLVFHAHDDDTVWHQPKGHPVAKGQTAIPKTIRDCLHMKTGNRLTRTGSLLSAARLINRRASSNCS
jgi:hypothetical protein